jgi:FKBP-type peptidyl-prolyl cis-trans isomerase 2
MTVAKAGDTVRIHYTGRLGDGGEFDSSMGREPLEFTLGEGAVIAGFEKAVMGMSVGEAKTVTIACDDAYGAHEEAGVEVIERSMIPAEVELEVGGQVRADGPDGEPVVLTIAAIDDETVTLDGNHPLAGHDLTFELELVAIV